MDTNKIELYQLDIKIFPINWYWQTILANKVFKKPIKYLGAN